MKQISGGWWLPSDDYYFGKLVPAGVSKKQDFLQPEEGTKQNFFQRDHLLKAFEFVKKWDYAIDVGAHVGFWAKDMADRFKHVYCFEPSPNTYSCLLKNMAEYNNVTMSPIALGQHVGSCDIARDDRRAQNSGSEYVVRKKKGDIAVQPLDALKVDGCDFLKLDVEGGEYHVLRGAIGTIQKHRPVVIMETDKKFAQRRFGVGDTAAMDFLVNVLQYREVAHIRPDRIFVAK